MHCVELGSDYILASQHKKPMHSTVLKSRLPQLHEESAMSRKVDNRNEV